MKLSAFLTMVLSNRTRILKLFTVFLISVCRLRGNNIREELYHLDLPLEKAMRKDVILQLFDQLSFL